MALDRATQEFLAQMAAMGGKPIHEQEPEEARELGKALTPMFGQGPDMARVEDTVLTAADGGTFQVRTLVPSQAVTGVVVYYHGGGWVVGDIDGFDTLGRQLADRAGCAVVLVNYRKAPENPYPAAVEDAWQALTWADENMTGIAGSRVPLIVAGDSAGGNLAAVVAQRSRDRSGPEIALQVLVYPVTDADLDTPSYRDPANQLLLSRESMVWFWGHYAPSDRRAEAEASPLRANDLSGLPPAIVLIAEHDVLRSEGEAYAAALQSAGVPVEQRLCEGQMHGFFSMVNLLPGCGEALDHVVAGIRRHLDGVSAGSQEATA